MEKIDTIERLLTKIQSSEKKVEELRSLELAKEKLLFFKKNEKRELFAKKVVFLALWTLEPEKTHIISLLGKKMMPLYLGVAFSTILFVSVYPSLSVPNCNLDTVHFVRMGDVYQFSLDFEVIKPFLF